MQSILDKLAEWLKELLISGILGNLSGMFDTVNTKVGEIAGEVGMTPSAWNGGVFNLIRSLSETVIIPIAGIILTFVMCYELIQLVIEKNNLHDVDTWIFFKWIFKTFVAVFLVTNTWNIVMAIFDVAQNVVSQSGGIISSSYLGNPENLRLATENAKKKRYKLHSFIAFLILCPVVSGAWLLPFFSGIQHGLYGGNDNSDFPIGQFICQSVKLSAQRSFPICRIPKKKLIHGDMIAGHELKKDLEARMLSLILNIGEIAGRKIHLITYFVTRLLLSCPRRLNC